jgi:ABC-type nitrate/sulfonate/bicarbonate transport system ATPase subunit
MIHPLIALQHIHYRHPDGDTNLFQDFSLNLEPGQCHVFLGRSGCGKSTLLRLVAGLIKPAQGAIAFPSVAAGTKIQQQFLFQDYDCFPWLTVFENVRKGSGPAPYPTADEVNAILEKVGLIHKKDVYPRSLSGGMRKRLGFARTLVRKPQLLLLDEPFASLDIALRSDMYDLLQELMADHGTTVLLVSHDLHEALILGDQLYVLGNCPATVVKHIANPFAHPRTEDIVRNEFYAQTHQLIADQLKVIL